MPFQLIHKDLTEMACDAIVNPTDPYFSGRGGTDRAVHQTAGEALTRECRTRLPLSEGEIAVTGGYDLPCRFVLHTVGPRWRGGEHHEPMLLRSCYVNALLMAKKMELHSIAFPLISSGTFGFPKDKVLRIAIDAISDFLETTDGEMDVYLCVLDRNAYTLSREIALREYLSTETAERSEVKFSVRSDAPMEAPDFSISFSASDNLADWIEKQDDSFAVTLLKLIDRSGMTDSKCYNKANVSKQTFYKIKNDPDYRPSKQTILGFAIALKLNLEETEQLLKTAGYSFSHSNRFDMIVEFYIANGVYDLFEINSALYQYDQPCIGC